MDFNLIILALDTSAKAASCAVLKDGLLLCESFINAGLTHSVTVMPMVRDMLDLAGITLEDIGLFAVSAGPGSFTGLRIGVSAVKGMAMALDKPCAAVSTLEALAYNLASFRGIIVAAMDARRNQVYTAAFRSGGQLEPENIMRVTQDEALPVSGLAERLKSYTEPVMLVGDGAELCYGSMRGMLPNVSLAPANLLHQRASSVCLAAANMEAYQSAGELAPSYLRLPQAERERMERSKE